MNPYSDRKYIVGALVVLISLILIGRLFSLQVMDASYKLSASSNTRRVVTQYPARGLIYDKDYDLLVYNVAAYDLNINPPELTAFDTADLARLLDVTPRQIKEGIEKAMNYSRFKPSVFLNMKLLSSKKYASLQEQLYKFPGFYVHPRTTRQYSYEIAPHALGYVAETSKEDVLDVQKYYKSGDYIGVSGVEKAYEHLLRGEKGRKVFLVDVHNVIKGSYQDGKLDKPAEVGKNISLTFDRELQQYGKRLMKKKIGSIVAIEPASGEILTVVSSPAYDPNKLTGREFPRNFRKLQNDTLNPLFDRSCQASYPPGSIFKVIQALIALQDSIITPNTRLNIDLSLVGDHAPPGVYDVRKAIRLSSNNFFYRLFKMMLQRGQVDNPYQDTELGFDIWWHHLLSFGLGQKLGSDLLHEKGGFIPDNQFYDLWYGDKRWKTSTIYSNGIGQGEILIVPLQMANLAAIIANRGYYYIPHLIKDIEGRPHSIEKFREKIFTTVDSLHFPPVIDAMEQVVIDGTAQIARIEDVSVCGKTGTAENPHGEDHSIFIAFAPKDDPEIAVAVYVENAGYGASWAAPIASLMIEKYLKGEVKRRWIENYVLSNKYLDEKKN